LSFDHPLSNARVSVRAPVPPDLAVALTALGLPLTPADDWAHAGTE
jgi:hypothetical protein